jgi:hypothetical protein
MGARCRVARSPGWRPIIRNIAAAIGEHGAMINEVLRVAEDGSMTLEAEPA